MNTIASVTLPHHVHAPRYDRQQLQSRIVHFGFGAFHRAHQALLTDRVLNAQGGDWGICEISLFSGDQLMSQLRAQNHLYTVLEKGADGNQVIIVGAVHECLNAKLDSLAAIIEKFCEPQVAIVSLTITEKAIVLTRPPVHSTPVIRGLFTIYKPLKNLTPHRVFSSKH